MCLLMVFFGVSLIFIGPYQAAFRCFTESAICCSLGLCGDKLHGTDPLPTASLSLQDLHQKPACCTGPAAGSSVSLFSYISGKTDKAAVVTE